MYALGSTYGKTLRITGQPRSKNNKLHVQIVSALGVSDAMRTIVDGNSPRYLGDVAQRSGRNMIGWKARVCASSMYVGPGQGFGYGDDRAHLIV